MFHVFLQKIAHDYIHSNKIEASQFRNNKPGIVWLKNFMKRHKLSHKKAEMISAAPKVTLLIFHHIWLLRGKVRSIFWICLVIKRLLFRTNSGVDMEITRITKKEIKKTAILQNLLFPWKIWLYLSTCHLSHLCIYKW